MEVILKGSSGDRRRNVKQNACRGKVPGGDKKKGGTDEKAKGQSGNSGGLGKRLTSGRIHKRVREIRGGTHNRLEAANAGQVMILGKRGNIRRTGMGKAGRRERWGKKKKGSAKPALTRRTVGPKISRETEGGTRT